MTIPNSYVIPFERALEIANKENITDLLYPLFVPDIFALLYSSKSNRSESPESEVEIPVPGEHLLYIKEEPTSPTHSTLSYTPDKHPVSTLPFQPDISRTLGTVSPAPQSVGTGGTRDNPGFACQLPSPAGSPATQTQPNTDSTEPIKPREGGSGDDKDGGYRYCLPYRKNN